MTTATALDNINKEIATIVAEWHTDTENDGKTHLLEGKTDDDKIYALNKAIRRISLLTVPEKLIVPSDSTEPKYSWLNDCQYIRVPAWLTNASGEELDIDEALCIACVYNAIYQMDSRQTEYMQKADRIARDYTSRYKQWLLTQPNGSPCP